MKADDIIKKYDLYVELRKHFRPIIAEELLSEVLKSEKRNDVIQEDFSRGYYARSEQVEYVIKKYIMDSSL